jgi:hypothetical protein
MASSLPIGRGMPISRPLMIVLAAAVLAAVGFYATQGGRDTAGVTAPVTEASSSPAPPQAVANSDAGAKSDKSDKSDKTANKSSTHASATKPGAADKSRRATSTTTAGVPRPVQKALHARKLVVLFFHARGPADDRATARAVAAVRGERGTAVFSAPIGRLSDYRGVIGELGISQAPAVVIIGKDRAARVVQGYIDPATLAQDVADAR